LTWLIRDNRQLLPAVYGGICSNGTTFEDLDPNGYANCPVFIVLMGPNVNTNLSCFFLFLGIVKTMCISRSSVHPTTATMPIHWTVPNTTSASSIIHYLTYYFYVHYFSFANLTILYVLFTIFFLSVQQSTFKDCQSDLVFNPETGRCDVVANVPSCQQLDSFKMVRQTKVIDRT
jgi:hypothetical protein